MTRGPDWPPSREAGPGEQTARLPLEDRGQGQVRGKPAAHRVSDGKESCECSRMCGGILRLFLRDSLHNGRQTDPEGVRGVRLRETWITMSPVQTGLCLLPGDPCRYCPRPLLKGKVQIPTGTIPKLRTFQFRGPNYFIIHIWNL